MAKARDVARVPLPRKAAGAYGIGVPSIPNPRGEQFARLIRDARKQAGMSQDDLAEQAGVNRSTVIRWESGDASRPDPDQVRAVCIILGIDPQQAAIALGYLRPEDLPAPDTGGRKLDPRILEVIEALEDPNVSETEKQEWVKYLMYLRQQARPARGTRNAS